MYSIKLWELQPQPWERRTFRSSNRWFTVNSGVSASH